MKRCRRFAAGLSVLLAAGCSLSDSGIVPTAQGTVHVGPGRPVAGIFDCAQRRLAELGAREASWDHEVTLRDEASGRLETGHFDDDNVSGFRLRLQYRPVDGAVDLRLRGAGAYFTDLGVEGALDEFEQGFESCLSPER
ncbi:hypothetical protein LDO32_07135 [Luteimonas sp. Y-2-2-4F]|nr:hypothetical protein [Luteimonas sp. Y-2-2-4F]MCD9031501.1 hypothetical protein [Luteimonas sp. Y-2-2-4F]